MKFTVTANVMTFTGVLDENTALESIRVALESVGKDNDQIYLDFSNVKRANSSGILQWLRIVRGIKVELVYQKCPVWMVGQFNMIAEFFSGSVKVNSILVPYYCCESDEYCFEEVILGKDVPLLESYDDYQMPPIKVGNLTFEPDVDPSEFLLFVTENSLFRRAA